ncbi:MAG: DUF4249 domain-containing protein [Bacteroidota bacterium]|nr:DUF4249 domain-containing protein [Bacteroidota bacterium]
MKFLKQQFIILSVFIILVFNYNSCIEPFIIETPEGSKNLVVDGFFTTEFKVHEVRLSYSSPYYSSGKLDPVYGATLQIISNLGEVYNLNEGNEGIYYTEPIAAEVGKSYKLSIESFSGKFYESRFEPVIAVHPFDTIQTEYRNDEFLRKKIIVSAKNIEQSVEPNFLYWDFTGHQEELRIYEDPEDTTAGEIMYPCITSEKCTNCLNISSNKFSSESIYNQYITNIPYTSTKKYVIKIDKYSISPNVYEYFNQINRIISNSGTIFDSPPTSIKGNIRNIHNDDESVHGYFYASDIFSKVFTIPRNIYLDDPDVLSIRPPRPCSKPPRDCAEAPLQLPDPAPCPQEPPIYWD